MKLQKSINSPNTTSDNKSLPRFVTKTKVYDQSKKNYCVNEEIRIKPPFVLSIKHNTIV